MQEPDGAVSAAELGPSVMPEFPEAEGLDQLVGRGKGPSAPVRESMAPSEPLQPAPPQPAPLPIELLETTLVQADAAVSEYANVAPEDRAFMRSLAESVHPLVVYYTAKANPLVALWATAAIGVIGYVGVKWKKSHETSKEA